MKSFIWSDSLPKTAGLYWVRKYGNDDTKDVVQISDRDIAESLVQYHARTDAMKTFQFCAIPSPGENNDESDITDRMKAVLDADFPDWVWKLKTGDDIGVHHYCGSWFPPGTQEWYPAKFICISGNKLYYQELRGHDNLYTSYTIYGVITPEELKLKTEAIEAYRAEHPDWESAGM